MPHSVSLEYFDASRTPSSNFISVASVIHWKEEARQRRATCWKAESYRYEPKSRELWRIVSVSVPPTHGWHGRVSTGARSRVSSDIKVHRCEGKTAGRRLKETLRHSEDDTDKLRRSGIEELFSRELNAQLPACVCLTAWEELTNGLFNEMSRWAENGGKSTRMWESDKKNNPNHSPCPTTLASPDQIFERENLKRNESELIWFNLNGTDC